jgi:FecR-like protein
MRGWRKPALAWLALAVYLLPATAFAQATKAGVVTTLEGNVTAARAVAAQPVVLKFKDDVFLQDRVVTGEQSFARLLLGGKAVVSIRERSAVTITEVPGRSTIDIESGKIALSVAGDRMQPGEVINIKTPNAVAGVRGTVVVAQVAYSMVGGAQQPASNLWVLRGVIEAVPTNAAGAAIGVPVPVGAMQSFSATPTSSSTGTFTLQQMSGIVQGLQAKGTADPGTASQAPARLEAVNTAVALLAALTGSPAVQQLATGTLPKITTPTATQAEAKITEAGDITSSPVVPGGSGLPQLVQLAQAPPPPVNTTTGPDVPDVIIDDQFVQLGKDQTLKTFSGTSTRGGTSPVIRIVGSFIVDGTLVVADTTANATLQTGPLMKVTDSTLDALRLLLVQGNLTSRGTSPLIALDPVTVNAQTLVEVATGGKLSLAGPLLTDLNGLVTTKQDSFLIAGTLSGTGASALVRLQGTNLNVGRAGSQASLFKITGPVTLSGGLLEATDTSILVNGDVIGVFSGAKVDSTSTSPFMLLNNTPLTAGVTDPSGTVLDGRLLLVSGIGGPDELTPATLTLAGPVLRAENGSVIDTNSKGLTLLTDGALVTRAPPVGTYPLIAVDGPNTQLNVGSASRSGRLFEITGSGPLQPPDPNGLQFGQQTPLQHKGGGALLEASNGASVNIRGSDGTVLRLDTALLEATAPIILLMGDRTRLVTSGNGIDLAKNARLQSTVPNDALVRIDSQARMEVPTGHLVNVAASRLTVAGDLLRMGSGATLNVGSLSFNGVLLNVLSGGVVNISGALVNFTGVNASINITNSLVPTNFINGVPIFVAAGGDIRNVAIGPAALALTGLNLKGNTIKINDTLLPTGAIAATGSLISVGANATVKIGLPSQPN